MKRGKSKKRKVQVKLPSLSGNGIILVVAAVILLIVLIVFFFSGCGKSAHRSPTAIVESMLEAYGKGKQKKVLDCYGQKKDPEESLLTEVQTMMEYLEAHGAQGIEIGQTDIIGESGPVSFVYALYRLELENEQKYPCLSTYAVHQKEVDEKYYVMAPSEITEEVSDAATEAYKKFMTSETYKNYLKEYNAFIKKNPGYEEKIIGKLGAE